MADMLFYHLERDPLDRVLPSLLEKSLARGWRCLVRVGTQDRCDALDTWLWTYREDSFLPHACDDDPGPRGAQRQPILLTVTQTNANAANVCFVVDGADIRDVGDYERIVYMFDGGNDAAVKTARETWKWAKSTGLAVTYWQQGERGGWERKA